MAKREKTLEQKLADSETIIEALSVYGIGICEISNGTGIPLTRVGEISLNDSHMSEREKESLRKLVDRRGLVGFSHFFENERKKEGIEEVVSNKPIFFYGVLTQNIADYIRDNKLEPEYLAQLTGTRKSTWEKFDSRNVREEVSYLNVIVSLYSDAKKRRQKYEFVKKHPNMPELRRSMFDILAVLDFAKKVHVTYGEIKNRTGLDVSWVIKNKEYRVRYGVLLRLYEFAAEKKVKADFLVKNRT